VTQVNQDTQTKIAKLEAMLEEDTAKNMYRIDRAAFTDEELFELEMKHIFEGNWIYLAHESQIPNVNDYLNIIGRQPVSSPATRTVSCTRSSTPAHRGATLAGTRRATSPASPARSTAGPSTTAASC
jgi:benzoate/toluate 1,2-dioxygenase alpha subunit